MSAAADPGPETLFNTPFGTFQLRRYPMRKQELLRAWCGADMLLLETLAGASLQEPVLVVNDDYGALSLPLAAAGTACTLWTDSALAAQALADNACANKTPAPALVWSTDPPPAGTALVLLRIPKQKALLEYQLAQLAPLLPAGATVLAAGMDKHLPTGLDNLFNRYIGPCERLRGRYKAHLWRARRSEQAPPAMPGDLSSYYCEPLGATLRSLPNVFSRQTLDLGTRFLLEQLSELQPVARAVDLACGNGVIGLVALQRSLARELWFCDESAQAIASARLNLEKVLPQQVTMAHFHHGDGLRDWAAPAPDLVLCNPPFHLQHTVDDYAGRRLLSQAAAVLAPGGQLCLVANRHLDYRATLAHGFRQQRILAQNRKFRIYLASR
ncbi:class I SAM-dependent methyltransferase [Haliea sp. E1-2-M8]|uniref:class I SAM-dependent methyltransferase n=1 Tax=Haliea sp. E1-2-M8 TaxID=3064706 RepID=UPI0027274E59|nr:class I SAM-dependent methyltransferase [Haliea sp. E1-2-M8]MDO8862353.1 class I SAM-dependent methyltransferase [Haliea sp. E1-2-M8]